MSKIAKEITEEIGKLGIVLWDTAIEQSVDRALEGRTIKRKNLNILIDGVVRETIRRIKAEENISKLGTSLLEAAQLIWKQGFKEEDLKSKLWDAEQEIHDLKQQLGRAQDWNEQLTDKQLNELQAHEQAEEKLQAELDRTNEDAKRDGETLQAMIQSPTGRDWVITGSTRIAQIASG